MHCRRCCSDDDFFFVYMFLFLFFYTCTSRRGSRTIGDSVSTVWWRGSFGAKEVNKVKSEYHWKGKQLDGLMYHSSNDASQSFLPDLTNIIYSVCGGAKEATAHRLSGNEHFGTPKSIVHGGTRSRQHCRRTHCSRPTKSTDGDYSTTKSGRMERSKTDGEERGRRRSTMSIRVFAEKEKADHQPRWSYEEPSQ